jgi:purine-binding chemotaxis protein CheW
MIEAGLEQYVVTRLGKERYGFNIRDINEIIKMQHITVIPNSKPHIVGVINLRGRIVPVSSLYCRFGLPEQPYDGRTRIVVVNFEQESIGIIVEAVERVVIFSEIQAPPPPKHSTDQSFIEGIGSSVDGLVSLLQLNLLLTEE